MCVRIDCNINLKPQMSTFCWMKEVREIAPSLRSKKMLLNLNNWVKKYESTEITFEENNENTHTWMTHPVIRPERC